jgi:hypothetical protein
VLRLAGNWLQAASARIAGFDLCLRMTLLLLLIYAGDFWQTRVPLRVLSVLGFLFYRLRGSAAFWFVIVVALALGNYSHWYVLDNHKYLFVYWCVAVFCCLLSQRPELVAGTSARWLLALSFSFAVLWKVHSPDYLSTGFFQYSLLLDPRFEAVARIFGGVTAHMNETNHAALQALINYQSQLQEVSLLTTTSLTRMAAAMTWWTVTIEALVACTLLAPDGSVVSQYRDFPLLLFIITTYLIAPVTGFGWILAIMGVAQCTDRRYWPSLYVFSVILLELYRLPWQHFLKRVLI